MSDRFYKDKRGGNYYNNKEDWRRNRDREGGHHYENREERPPRKEYVDHDDPNNQRNKNAANPDRQIVSYDDLF